MKYNIAIVFKEEINQSIYDTYNKIKDNLDIAFGLQNNSTPHSTIIKFESKNELTSKEIKTILTDIDDITVGFSGLTLLPSHSGGYWVEISVLKSNQIIDLQNILIQRLKKVKILSGIEDRFRPHITLAKVKGGTINLDDLSYLLLRKKSVKAEVVIGRADSIFEFQKI